MPLYEYACMSCNQTFERLRPMVQMDDPASCPECSGEGKRILSVFAAFTSNGEGQSMAVAGGGGCCGGVGGGACACSMAM